MPITYKNLFPKIQDFENLYLAHRKARRDGKRKRPMVAEFEHNLGENLLRLQAELAAETYRPRSYRTFTVIERKERVISAAHYRDRVVHHALMAIVQPIFEARFIHDSYACRAGKGTHRALDRAQYFARRYPYVLQCDVREFFPSIDHAILRSQLARHIACPPTLRLIDTILASGTRRRSTRSRTASTSWAGGSSPSTSGCGGTTCAMPCAGCGANSFRLPLATCAMPN